jgi:uncharacterized membrane protein
LRLRFLNLSNSLLKLEQKIYDKHTKIVFDTLVFYLVFVALCEKEYKKAIAKKGRTKQRKQEKGEKECA